MIKIVERDYLIEQREGWREAGKKIGFTSGVFDLLHPGHVDYLRRARSQCDLLIAGVNTDKSVAGRKGPARPINPLQDRLRTLEGLTSVDFIFAFEEPNNNETVKLLQPDVYFKAGDYNIDQLSSAPLVQEYGGKVVIIPLEGGWSSTRIIERVLNKELGRLCVAEQRAEYEAAPAAFVDRDGTIIEHVEYLHEPEKVKLIPGALEGLKKLREAGYRIVVTTNQPGIGMGYFSKEDFFAVNREILIQASRVGLDIDRIYYSPHSKADNSSWRKPGTGMIDRAVKDLNIVLEESVVIGDMTSDLMLASNAGCKSALVKTGRAGKDGLYQVQPDWSADDLGSVVELILKEGS